MIRHSEICHQYTCRLCTFIRETYRRIKGDSTDKEVKDRHTAVYHMGRALLEGVEYFGKSLWKKDKIYHGLSLTMFFSEFTGYFHAPTSTTIDKSIGMFSLMII